MKQKNTWFGVSDIRAESIQDRRTETAGAEQGIFHDQVGGCQFIIMANQSYFRSKF